MIRNVVFDVGNVFVTWSPETIVTRTFGAPIEGRAIEIFGSATWKALNLGEITFHEAAKQYQSRLGLTSHETDGLFFHVTDHQTSVPGTDALARSLKHAGYRVFGLTDNVREIVAYQRKQFQFWQLFEGVVISAEIGLVKPDAAIFQHLLRSFDLSPNETVFLDDMEHNVDGARGVGMKALVFCDAAQCATALRQLGLSFKI